MNDIFNQHKENLKRHLLQSYNRDLSLDDFYSWIDETYLMCENLVKIMKNNMKNHSNNNEELERVLKEYWNIREIRKFMGEVHPLKIFLKSNCHDLSFDSVFLTDGNENHDAILKKGNQEICVEITGTQDGEFILYSLLHMYRFDSTPSMGATTDELCKALKNGNPVEQRFERVDESIKKEAEKVSEAIKKKCEKNYPDGTLLIVTAFPFPKESDFKQYYDLSRYEFDRLNRLNINPASPENPLIHIDNTDAFKVCLTPWDFFRLSMEKLPENSEKFNGIYLIGLYDKHCKSLSPRT